MPIEKSLVADVVHVWSKDRALDRSDEEKYKAQWSSFVKSHKLEDLQPIIREGMEPARFTLVPLKRKQLLAVNELRALVMDDAIVAMSLRGISQFFIRGERVEFKSFETDLGPRVDGSVLDQIYDPHLFAELAGVVLFISRLDP